ncbi:hypothetical protein ACFYXM_35935 [Streptomyces sp. NPDC002476]|uniref:hypothetical protein n=1 Tax=Streptomyces sp. NPDC002476 TaxID=3364648 RepID=UPI00367C0C8D
MALTREFGGVDSRLWTMAQPIVPSGPAAVVSLGSVVSDDDTVAGDGEPVAAGLHPRRLDRVRPVQLGRTGITQPNR